MWSRYSRGEKMSNCEKCGGLGHYYTIKNAGLVNQLPVKGEREKCAACDGTGKDLIKSINEKTKIPFDKDKAFAGDDIINEEGEIGKVVFVTPDRDEYVMLTFLTVFKKNDGYEGYHCQWNRIDKDDGELLSHTYYMLPKKITYWINFYNNGGTACFKSKPYADEAADNLSPHGVLRIRCIPVEIEQGEILRGYG